MSTSDILEMVRALTPAEQRELLREIEGMLAVESRNGTPEAPSTAALVDGLLELSSPGGPADGADQHDHYIYGTPRR